MGRKGANALHWASRFANTTDLIDAILEMGKFDIDGGDDDRRTPLHHAISRTNREINVRYLIQLGAD